MLLFNLEYSLLSCYALNLLGFVVVVVFKQYYFIQQWFVPTLITCFGKGSVVFRSEPKKARGRTHATSPYSEAASLPWWLQSMDIIPTIRSRFLMLGPFAAAELGLGSPVPPALVWLGMMLPGVSGWASPTVDTRYVQGKAVSIKNMYSPYLNIPKKQSSSSLWPE